jgi:hypothetical protein
MHWVQAPPTNGSPEQLLYPSSLPQKKLNGLERRVIGAMHWQTAGWPFMRVPEKNDAPFTPEQDCVKQVRSHVQAGTLACGTIP